MKRNVIILCSIVSFLFLTGYTNDEVGLFDTKPDTSFLAGIRYDQMIVGFDSMKNGNVTEDTLSLVNVPDATLIPTFQTSGCIEIPSPGPSTVNMNCGTPPEPIPPTGYVDTGCTGCGIRSWKTKCESWAPGAEKCILPYKYFYPIPSGH